MKYKVGDRVRIVSDRTKNMNSNGDMDKYLGTVMTIKEAHKTFAFGISYHYRMVEDKCEWFWNDEMIAGLASEVPFDFDAWKYKKVCMHCKTREEAEDFCNEMHKAGLTWCSGRSYLSRNYFEPYEEQTCYCFNKGRYNSIVGAKDKGYTILEWSDYRSTEPKDEEQEKIMETKIDEPLSYQEAMKIKRKICENVDRTCSDCPIVSSADECNEFFTYYSGDAETALKKWLAEHPVKTNEQKCNEMFLEVFGMQYATALMHPDWWQQEYVEPYEEKE